MSGVEEVEEYTDEEGGEGQDQDQVSTRHLRRLRKVIWKRPNTERLLGPQLSPLAPSDRVQRWVGSDGVLHSSPVTFEPACRHRPSLGVLTRMRRCVAQSGSRSGSARRSSLDEDETEEERAERIERTTLPPPNGTQRSQLADINEGSMMIDTASRDRHEFDVLPCVCR